MAMNDRAMTMTMTMPMTMTMATATTMTRPYFFAVQTAQQALELTIDSAIEQVLLAHELIPAVGPEAQLGKLDFGTTVAVDEALAPRWERARACAIAAPTGEETSTAIAAAQLMIMLMTMLMTIDDDCVMTMFMAMIVT